MEHVTCTQWLEDLKWIEKGDCVYVVSDVLELAKEIRKSGSRFRPECLIETLQELTSDTGTLLFPTFNWDFCKGITFDYCKTAVRTGALSKKALERSEFLRTKHPIYSFAVWGKDKDMLGQMDPKDSFGAGTIFEYMHEKNAKVLVIGLPALSGVTYIHHVEQVVGVPYRYNKSFYGKYIDSQGVEEEKEYRMYVRDLYMDPRHINGFRPLEDKMKRMELIQTRRYCGVDFSLLRVRDLDKAVKEDIQRNDSKCMYVYNGQSS